MGYFERKAFEKGVSGKAPGILDHVITPELAGEQERGYKQHLANEDLARKIARQQDVQPIDFSPPPSKEELERRCERDTRAMYVTYACLAFLLCGISSCAFGTVLIECAPTHSCNPALGAKIIIVSIVAEIVCVIYWFFKLAE